MQIFKSFPSLKLIYDYFKDIIKFHSLLNIPVIWITPIGIKISQLINISTQNKVSIRFGKKTNTVVFWEKTDKLDKRKQVYAIIPYIIHSLDASHLMNIINSADNIKNIYPILDCFGTHPNNLDTLIYLVTPELFLIYANSKFLIDIMIDLFKL